MLIRKAYKYRLYHTQEQEKQLALQFGHARFIYNHFLGERKRYYEAHRDGLNGKKRLSCVDTNRMLTALKKDEEYARLKEADSQVLQESLRNLDRAYQNFFLRVKNKEDPGHAQPQTERQPA